MASTIIDIKNYRHKTICRYFNVVIQKVLMNTTTEHTSINVYKYILDEHFTLLQIR